MSINGFTRQVSFPNVGNLLAEIIFRIIEEYLDGFPRELVN